MLSHFGAEAPAKLNLYATQIEDALIQALTHQQQQAQAILHQHAYITEVQDVLAAAAGDREAMIAILTDPNILSDYTTKFFGPDGPMPVHTEAEQAQAAINAGLITIDSPLMPPTGNPRMEFDPNAYQQTAEQQAAQQQPFQRPQIPMPQPGGPRLAGAENVWSAFSQTMDVRPEEAWKLLSMASPDDVRRKVLFMEG